MMDFVRRIVNSTDNTSLFSVGQAGFIIKSSSGQLLGIDMYLTECVERIEGNKGFKRLLPQILSPRDIVFDVIIATHHHRDHFDVDAMSDLMANGHTHLYAARDCEQDVDELGIDKHFVTFVSPGDVCRNGDFELCFVTCDHGKSAPFAIGIVIKVDGRVIYETGDTCLRKDLIDEVNAFGKIDVLIAPINGMYGNLNEKECAILARSLNPKLTIPCHYGMFASHRGDVGAFYDLMNSNFPDLPFEILGQGEEYIIK